MHSYDTVSAALADLKNQEFTTDFNVAFDKIKCSEPVFASPLPSLKLLNITALKEVLIPAMKQLYMQLQQKMAA